jgi:hypothetical protein
MGTASVAAAAAAAALEEEESEEAEGAEEAGRSGRVAEADRRLLAASDSTSTRRRTCSSRMVGYAAFQVLCYMLFIIATGLGIWLTETIKFGRFDLVSTTLSENMDDVLWVRS